MRTAELIFTLTLISLIGLTFAGLMVGVFSPAESGLVAGFAGLSTILHGVLK